MIAKLPSATGIHILVLVGLLAPAGCIQHCDLFGYNIDPQFVVQCSGINQDNMQEVTAILTEIKIRYSTKIIYMECFESVGADFPDDIFKDYRIVSLTMNNCGFTELPYGILSNLDKKVTSLDFSGNRIASIDAERLNSLPFTSGLTDLALQSNNITDLPPDAFAGYESLQSLTLQDNQIQELVDKTFSGLTNLQALYLFQNQIQTIESGAFAIMPILQLLVLDSNHIEALSEGTFSKENQTDLVEIPLEGNPFHCDCSLQWLKDYLISIDYLVASGATCVSPKIGPFAAIDFCAP